MSEEELSRYSFDPRFRNLTLEDFLNLKRLENAEEVAKMYASQTNPLGLGFIRIPANKVQETAENIRNNIAKLHAKLQSTFDTNKRAELERDLKSELFLLDSLLTTGMVEGPECIFNGTSIMARGYKPDIATYNPDFTNNYEEKHYRKYDLGKDAETRATKIKSAPLGTTFQVVKNGIPTHYMMKTGVDKEGNNLYTYARGEKSLGMRNNFHWNNEVETLLNAYLYLGNPEQQELWRQEYQQLPSNFKILALHTELPRLEVSPAIADTQNVNIPVIKQEKKKKKKKLFRQFGGIINYLDYIQ